MSIILVGFLMIISLIITAACLGSENIIGGIITGLLTLSLFCWLLIAAKQPTQYEAPTEEKLIVIENGNFKKQLVIVKGKIVDVTEKTKTWLNKDTVTVKEKTRITYCGIDFHTSGFVIDEIEVNGEK